MKNKLVRYVLICFIGFAVIILSFLWIFEIFLFDSYYKYTKTRTIKETALKVSEYYREKNYEDLLDVLSYQEGVCVEIDYNNKTVYTSNSMEAGCLSNKRDSKYKYKSDFISSSSNERVYTIVNNLLKNKTLVYAMKIDDDVNLYVNTSIEPIDASVNILQTVLIRITIIVFIIAIVIAVYLSRLISDPILKLNQKAKKLAKGDFNTNGSLHSNIKEIEELNDSMNYAIEELSKIDETRRDLLANVSHDLKTPLTMIKAYAELNRDLNTRNKKKNIENMNIIIEEADRLNNLVNDILELSKLQSNMKEVNYSQFDLTEVIRSIINRFNIYENIEEYNFVFEYDKPLIINADKQKIEQVIYNLIGNAMNYTGDDKKIIIEIEEDSKKYRVSIIDTGKGIDKEELDLIWDKYYKNDKHHKRNKVGSGIGLSIVKEVLLLHKFKYGVESKKGKGSRFYFEINK